MCRWSRYRRHRACDHDDRSADDFDDRTGRAAGTCRERSSKRSCCCNRICTRRATAADRRHASGTRAEEGHVPTGQVEGTHASQRQRPRKGATGERQGAPESGNIRIGEDDTVERVAHEHEGRTRRTPTARRAGGVHGAVPPGAQHQPGGGTEMRACMRARVRACVCACVRACVPVCQRVCLCAAAEVYCGHR